MASRRFSQAIAEGDGISIVPEVGDGAAARSAESEGAEAVVVRGDLAGVRGVTELPILARNGEMFADLAQRGLARLCISCLIHRARLQQEFLTAPVKLEVEAHAGLVQHQPINAGRAPIASAIQRDVDAIDFAASRPGQPGDDIEAFLPYRRLW